MRTNATPVHAGYFADPFVWRHAGVYYAVGTGAAEAQGEAAARVFPLLRSEDFWTWQPAGRVLVRPTLSLGDTFWAPEVAFEGGRFYLYYSVGHEDREHQLRVATALRPEGPYEDVAGPLIDPGTYPFTIDPHPFRDKDGCWYLFYARDFLDDCGGARAGTALAVRRMEGMTRLDDRELLVLRAAHDWQRFLKDRPMYGRVFDWHTLEGSCVCRHAGRYYCFYSGGRWQSDRYGVDYGIADRVEGPYAAVGAEDGPRVLRTVPGKILGPGHNSIVLGPDGVSEYLAYHAWDAGMTARRMFLAQLVWTPHGPRCAG